MSTGGRNEVISCYRLVKIRVMIYIKARRGWVYESKVFGSFKENI
jgi:hypothetical protein